MSCQHPVELQQTAPCSRPSRVTGIRQGGAHLETLVPGAQLGVAGSPVAVELVSIAVHAGGPSGQGLGVVLDCLWVLLPSKGLPNQARWFS